MNKDKFKDYATFVEKFEEKKTTDDCYTPPEIMRIIFDYVEKCTGISQDHYVRPFYPGGDYEHYDYPENCIVVDNPPFSILAKIIDFYTKNNIKFFLFAPSLTIMCNLNNRFNFSIIYINKPIKYENKANVSTAFITNIPKRHYAIYSEELDEKIRNVLNKEKLPPLITQIPNFVNGCTIKKYKITKPQYYDTMEFIKKWNGKHIYGYGFIKKAPE